jgi:hypothetical protein
VVGSQRKERSKKSLKIPKGGNHNLYIEEEQTIQWPKEIQRTNNDLQNIHIKLFNTKMICHWNQKLIISSVFCNRFVLFDYLNKKIRDRKNGIYCNTKDKQRSTKHTYKTKDRVTRTPLKTGDELRCSRRVGSSCSTSYTHLLF